MQFNVVLQYLDKAMLIRTKERLRSESKAINEINTHMTVWDVAKIDVRQSNHQYTDRDKLCHAPNQGHIEQEYTHLL